MGAHGMGGAIEGQAIGIPPPNDAPPHRPFIFPKLPPPIPENGKASCPIPPIDEPNPPQMPDMMPLLKLLPG